MLMNFSWDFADTPVPGTAVGASAPPAMEAPGAPLF
jgi:hypothetical protein